MIKIVDKRSEQKPQLPFFTRSGEDYYLYFEKDGGKVGCVDVSGDYGEISTYENMDDAMKWANEEELITVELHVVR